MSVFKRRMWKKKLEEWEKNTPEEDRWKPMRFGDKKENEVSAWTVAIGNLAVPWENTKKEVDDSLTVINYIATLDGYIGLYPLWPKGTLLLFKSENHAKRARNLIEAKGVQVGSNITEVFVDKRFV